jgi:putative methyltransferase (TIGR04325 family)
MSSMSLPRQLISRSFEKLARNPDSMVYRCVDGLKRSGLLDRKQHWTGIYGSFSQVPKSGGGFDDGYWTELLVPQTLALKKKIEAAEWGTFRRVQAEDALLPELVASNLPTSTPLRITDFGGGLGLAYLHLRASLGREIPLQFSVIERPAVCDRGRQIFADDPAIRFVPSFSEAGPADIVYCSTALQYVDDYGGLFREIAAAKPKFLLLVNLSAGPNPTFVTGQLSVKGSVIPYRFFNLDTFLAEMSELGFAAVMRTSCSRAYSQSNFPPSHRMGTTCNVLFKL